MINNEKVNSINIGKLLQKNIGNKVTLNYQREDKIKTAEFQCPEDECILGLNMLISGNIETKIIKFGLGGAIVAGLHEIKAQTKLTLFALGKLGTSLFSFNKEKMNAGLNKLTGPVGAVKFGEMLLKEGGWIMYL